MDPRPIELEELLAHTGWVRRLAARLVRDAASADDVSQEVWAAALRTPPRDRSNLRAWLGAAVRNAVRSLHRAEVRRREREQSATEEREVADPAEFVQRAELQRQLVELVLALEEPQRTLVIAHWFEGLSLAAAARRLGLSERVARSRMESALGVLRRRLDDRAGGRRAWCLAFAAWTRSQPAASLGAASLVVGGGLVVWKIALASVVVLAGVAWLLRPDASSAASVGTVAPAQSVETASVLEPRALVDESVETARIPADAAPRLALSSAAKPAPEHRWVRGRITGLPQGSSERATVSARFLGSSWVPRTATLQASPDGEFELELTNLMVEWQRYEATPTFLHVTVDHPRCLREIVQASFESAVRRRRSDGGDDLVYTCDVHLGPAASVVGRVMLPKGSDVLLERVQAGLYAVEADAIDRTGVVDFAYCDGEGQFRLRANRTGSFVVIVRAPRLMPGMMNLELARGGETDVGVIPCELGSSISGVVLRNGRPVVADIGAYLERKSDSFITWNATSQYDRGDLGLADTGLMRRYAFTTSDERGRFELNGLGAADYEIIVEAVSDLPMRLGMRTQGTGVVVKAPATDVVLTRTPPVLCLMVTVDGVAQEPSELKGLDAYLREAQDGAFANPLYRSDWPREYRIGVPWDTSYELYVEPGRFEGVRLAIPALAPGEERVLRLDLHRSRAAASVRIAVESPLAEVPQALAVRVVQLSTGEFGASQTISRGENGRYLIPDLAPGVRRIEIGPVEQPWTSDISNLLSTTVEVDVPETGVADCTIRPEVGARLRLSAKDERGGFVRTAVELRDARGERVETRFFCLTPTGSYGCGWYLCEQGINDHPALPAGTYDLTLTADGYETTQRRFELVQGETLTLEVPMRAR